MVKYKRYPPEVRRKAVSMVIENVSENNSQWGNI